MTRFLRSALLVDDLTSDLRRSLYLTLCLAVALLTLGVVVPVNIGLGLPAISTAATVAFAIVALALYGLARRGRFYPVVLLAAAVLASAIAFFPNAGSSGSVDYFFFPELLFTAFFFSGVRRVIGMAATLAVGAILIWLDWQHPGLATPFRTATDRSLDLLAGFLVSGSVCGIIVSVTVTGYRLERARLAESRALLSAVIDSTDDCVCLVDPIEGRLKLFNRAFADAASASGTPPQPGQALETVGRFEPLADWMAYYRRALDEGAFMVEHVEPRTGRALLLSFGPVVHDGTLVGVATFEKDVTATRRAEEGRAEMAERLMRSQQLESLGRLAGGMAHEFNNMLGSIVGHADMLLDDETDPERRQDLAAILKAARRSAALTGKMLAFGRRGKNIVESLDLGSVAVEALAVLRPSLRPDVRVSIETGAGWTVNGDPSQMSQLVVELGLNANEAMPEGGVLTVRTADVTLEGAGGPLAGLPAGDYVSLAVSDTGVGMSADIVPHVFEPFFTTKSAQEDPGRGLGLSTVYGIVHAHRGGLAVDSQPGAGTTVTVYLPRGLEAAPTETVETLSGDRRMVLVVDDEAMLREFAVKAFARLGYEVVVAEDGAEGVRAFAEHHGELAGVLLDLKMPRKGGAEAFEEIRAIDDSVPVVISSGYGDNEEAQALISHGAKGLLAKPFRVADLAKHFPIAGPRGGV